MRIVFETETCGRCGGTGKYSFNQIDGDRCYGCKGAAKKWSRKGTTARKGYEKALAEQLSVAYADIKIGDKIYVNVDTSMTGIRYGWTEVLDIRTDEFNAGHVLVATKRGLGFGTRSESTVMRHDREAIVRIMASIARRYSGATLAD